MSDGSIRAFVQARMSSQRFPGKVLAPFRGLPIIGHVIAAVTETFGDRVPLTVLTSVEPSDDPLAAHLAHLGVDVFRGPLDDVFERFRECQRTRPSTWMLRLNADSPLLRPDVLRSVVQKPLEADCDLVTTTFPRTYPKGQNAELIRSEVFLGVPIQELDTDDREHVTRFFYRHSSRFRIANIASPDPSWADVSLAIDTPEDLDRLERLSDANLRSFGCKTSLEGRIRC